MGILNITPDSFHKDSRFNPYEEGFLKKAKEMLDNGTSIIDIGGYSSRPGADEVTETEEIDRVTPAIEILTKNFPEITISIDTFRKNVAKIALESGAKIVNDISGGDLDKEMLPFIIDRNCPYILMHMRGNPKKMQDLIYYNDFFPEIIHEIYSKANYLRKNGVKDIIIDPGFGFAKSLEQNYSLLKNLEIFNDENYPILAGLSRKSMIYKHLKITPEESLEASTQLNMLALLKNAKIIRTHDVLAAKHTIALYELLK
ncbi:dihydropteroate synthase [Lacihabitans sp. LS3-19]|nr:dihydropteroate synthase [Lacihabitans sp. LS3-19]